jgi:hypothetical protein
MVSGTAPPERFDRAALGWGLSSLMRRLGLLLGVGFVTACGSFSSPGWMPPPISPSPSWVVLSSDWVCAQMGIGTRPDGNLYNYCAIYNAHGVFRNTGPASSAAARFSLHGFPNSVVCTAAIPPTATDAVSEASCQVPRDVMADYSTPPDATVT